MTSAEKTLISAIVIEAATKIGLNKHDCSVLLDMIKTQAECEIVLKTLARTRLLKDWR